MAAESRGLRVCLLSRSEPGTTGTSRYVSALLPELERAGCNPMVVHPRTPAHVARASAVGRKVGLDPAAFFASYPVSMSWPDADVYHLTGQTYASVLLFGPPPGPAVVTVHDIIPYVVRNNPALRVYRHALHRFFDWLALRGLRRAQALLADSDWTKQTIAQHAQIRAERITTIPLGVDHERYRPMPVPEDFRRRYGLTFEKPCALYVGSEDPRKNLPTLFRALAKVRSVIPGLRLIKAGRGHFAAERKRLETLAARLGLPVQFLDDVPEEDLPLLYNSANVYVQPSLLEGFGLPVLEAMACGTRVVGAATSALLELSGADTLLCAPTVEGIAHGLEQALAENDYRADAAAQRRSWAMRFSWVRTSEATATVYRRIAAGAHAST